MSERMSIDDLLSRCYNTLEEARKAVACLPRTDPDRHIFFCGQIDNGMTVYVRASDEKHAEIISSFWYGYGCLHVFKIRPDACPGCGKNFDGMIHEIERGRTKQKESLADAAEAFLLANLAENVPVAC